MTDNKLKNGLIIILLVLLIILVFSKVYYIFEPVFDILIMFVGPVIIGGFIYYWLRPITRKLSKGKFKKYKGLISIVVILVFFIFISVVISLSGVKLKEEFQSFVYQIVDEDSGIINNINSELSKINIDMSMFNKYVGEMKEKIIDFLSNVPKMFSSIGDFATQITLIPFVLFYLLKEEDEIAYSIKNRLNSKYKEDELDLLKDLDSVLSTYIVGQLLVALIIGALMFIGYLIIKMPNPLLLATFSVVTAVIPLIGAFLGIIPALFLSLTIGFDMFIKVIVLSIIVQQLEGNLITPNLMGKRLNIHPFIVMIVIIISINLLGIFGAFIGIPLYLLISISIKEIIKMRKKYKMSN